MEIDREIIQIAPFNIYRDKWPAHLTDRTRAYIQWSGEIFNQEKPKTIGSIVITHFSGRYQPNHLYFYAFGNFRKPYSAMKVLAELLATVYAEINILPVIKPILSPDWPFDKKVDRSIRKNGFLTYSVEELAK